MSTGEGHSAKQAELIELLSDACAKQLEMEGKMTYDGIMNISGIKSRSTVQDLFPQIRERQILKLKFLSEAAKEVRFPEQALIELRNWALNTAETALSKDREELQEQIKDLQLKRQEVAAEAGELHAKINELNMELGKLTATNDEKSRQIENLEGQLKTERSKAEADNHSLRESNAELEGRLNAKEDLLKELSEENAALKGEIDHRDELIEQAKEKAEEDVRRFNALRLEYEQQTKALDQVRSEHSKAVEQAAKLREERASLKRDNQEREAAWLTERDKLKIELHNMAGLAHQLEISREESSQQSERIKELEGGLNEYKQKCEVLQAELRIAEDKAELVEELRAMLRNQSK